MHGASDPRIKVKWAKKHIPQLNSLIEGFFSTDPYSVVENIDPQSGKKRYYLRIEQIIPDDIVCLTGDILHPSRDCFAITLPS
jgi:hypothetical protein